MYEAEVGKGFLSCSIYQGGVHQPYSELQGKQSAMPDRLVKKYKKTSQPGGSVFLQDREPLMLQNSSFMAEMRHRSWSLCNGYFSCIP